MNNQFNNINYIIQLSDIHIRLLKRHDEYKIIFKKFIDFLNKIDSNVLSHTCLVITGDLFHTKTVLSPEAVDLCSYFLNECANILPVIIIPGNHDFLLSNQNRLDNISPIINALKHKNITYIKNSGITTFRNITFVHFSAIDENNPEKYIKFKDIPYKLSYTSDYIIALYHGTVNGALNSAGYVFNNRNVDLPLFDGFDMVLLGDIHKYQVLQDYNKKLKKPLVAYAGSMIQQDHGELLNDHGFIIWQLNIPKINFVKLQNDYGYYTIRIENGKLITNIPNNLPNNLRIRTLCCNTVPSQVKQILNYIKNKYNIIESTFIRTDCDSSEVVESADLEKLNISNVFDVNYQNELISKFLQSNNISSNIIQNVQKLNIEINSKIAKEKVPNNIRWKPKKFEFNNMFSYGENNVIDFTKLKGIVGLFAQNAAGKCVNKHTQLTVNYDSQYIKNKIGIIPLKLLNTNIIEIIDVYNIFKNYGDLNLHVKTPYGYKKIEACDITAFNSPLIKITTQLGKFLIGSPDHKVYANNFAFIKLKKLNTNDYINTINGSERIVNIEELDYKEDLYDIQVADVHQYYSNGILSHNSSVLEALTFCIFDKFSKGFKASDVINNQKNGFSCKFNFEINGVDYFIERSGNFTKRGTVPVSVKFYKIENNQQIFLNGEARRSTNDIIRDYIGTYEDFILTVLSIQNNKFGSFIDLGQSERKDMLCQFIGLTIFDQLLEIASENFKETLILMKNLDLDNLNLQKSNFEIKINEFATKLSSLNENLIIKKKEKLELDAKLISLLNNVNNSEQKSYNITELNNKKTLLINKHDELCNNIKKTNDSIKNCHTKTDECQLKINTLSYINDKPIQEVYDKYNEINKQFLARKREIDKFKLIIKSKLDKVNKLKHHEYDPKCKYCMNNAFVKDAIQAQHELISDKDTSDKLVSEYKELELKLNKMSDIPDKYDEYTDLLKDKENNEYKLLSLSNLLLQYENKDKECEHKLDIINNNIIEYFNNENIIKKNNELNLQINLIKDKIVTIEKEISDINSNIINTSTEKGKLELQLTDVIHDIDHFKKLEESYDAYNYYIKCIDRDGIPYKIIQSSIPTIENEINNILRQIVEFTISLQTDGKNIITNIVYDDKKWALEMSSGMEKFISGLAIRIALINISNLPRPNMLCIDEGFGCVDSEHLDQMGNLFSYLKNKFDFIWIISHLEQMKDIVDIQVEIEKENGFSKIHI